MDTETPSAQFRHVHEFYVRFGDIDSQGHVNNVKFLGYLEDARQEMLHGDPVRRGEQPVRGMVVVRHEIDYRRPLPLTVDPVRVETWVTELRAASCALAYEVRDAEHVYATATSKLAAFDVAEGRPRRFTEAERELLSRYLPRG